MVDSNIKMKKIHKQNKFIYLITIIAVVAIGVVLIATRPLNNKTYTTAGPNTKGSTPDNRAVKNGIIYDVVLVKRSSISSAT